MARSKQASAHSKGSTKDLRINIQIVQNILPICSDSSKRTAPIVKILLLSFAVP